jgi:hypothetical protein
MGAQGEQPVKANSDLDNIDVKVRGEERCAGPLRNRSAV